MAYNISIYGIYYVMAYIMSTVHMTIPKTLQLMQSTPCY